jgi:hypothetical protein
MTEADNQVTRRYAPRFDGRGHKRQEVTVVLLDARELLQKARMEGPVVNSAGNGPWLMKKRKEAG